MTLYYRLGSNLYVNVTNLCPSDCEFCIRGHMDGVGSADSLWLSHEPNLEELMQAYDLWVEQDREPIDEIVFCGFGEPLMRAGLVCELAGWLRSKQSRPIRLNTNGLVKLINPDFDQAKLSVFNTISISLNADTKEEYLRVTRPSFGIGSFEVMLDFAKALKKITDVRFTILETLGTERQKKCRDLADSMGIPLIVRSFT